MGDRWVRCTGHGGREVLVNLGNALTIQRLSGAAGNDFTRINFSIDGDGKNGLSVQEHPDEILKLKAL
ncbi:hypothetical protein LPW26_08000 [Rhodopseudomonas sp. HC1]|uniref:hypothetical protein n=1 Tax=Rhodopseudomonas infernalis TaxID=2897386 RepID=UPI001EE8B493|nr:hypothetical protein [Rhodopseudomonas infernalis]MCG6204573.1 hypothetical protein [Rhodopseudomonas infernalis]